MDNDAQFLMSSASGAMEERERLRSKHERLRHEAAAWKVMQLKEAAALGEQLNELDGETRELEARLAGLDEQATRRQYMSMRESTEEAEARRLKCGYLHGQVAGWAAEFERVTAITGVRFNEGKSDAVDKVVSIYSANELRNKSLFKFVTEDIESQKEALQVALENEEMLAAALEAEQTAHDTADAAADAERISAGEAGEHLEWQLGQASKGVDAILPILNKLGLATFDSAGLSMPQHMKDKELGPQAVPAFLALLEDALHAVLNSAAIVVHARAPPAPEESDEVVETKGTSKSLLPLAKGFDEGVTANLALLRRLSSPKHLMTARGAESVLHNDSSEPLLQTLQ